MALPDAATKLRLVLDYVPCEACLAHEVADQELLCSICARLDRRVAVRVGTRTSIIIERPSPPPEPVVIAPAPPTATAPVAEPEPEPTREVVVRLADEPSVDREGVIEVVLEPLPVRAPLAAAAPVVEAAPEPEPEAEDEGFDVSDIAVFTKARDEFFDYKAGPAPARSTSERPPTPPPTPPPAVRAPEPEEVIEDDFVFRPPPAAEPPPPPAEERLVAEETIPQEEIPVEEPASEHDKWAPPPDFLAEESVEAAAPEEVILETEIEEPTDTVVEDEVIETEILPPAEEEVVEMEVIEDEPVLETEVVEDEIVEMEVLPDDEPTPAAAATGAGDLYRLRGFDVKSERGLAAIEIHEIAHLSGHDAGELAERTGLPFDRLKPWIEVADLVHEVGIPIDAAVALVAAGVRGPQGLRDAEPDDLADRVAAFGGYKIDVRDLRRWKRRA